MSAPRDDSESESVPPANAVFAERDETPFAWEAVSLPRKNAPAPNPKNASASAASSSNTGASSVRM